MHAAAYLISLHVCVQGLHQAACRQYLPGHEVMFSYCKQCDTSRRSAILAFSKLLHMQHLRTWELFRSGLAELAQVLAMGVDTFQADVDMGQRATPRWVTST